MEREALIKAGMARSASLFRRAGEDPAAFAELLGRTSDGNIYEIQPFQQRWFEAIEKHDRVLIEAPPEFGKSELISRLLLSWKIGKNPSIHAAFIGWKEKEAYKSAKAVAATIFENPLYKAVFPEIRSAKGKLKTERQDGFKVRVPGDYSRDLTLEAFTWGGISGGQRFDLLIVDDILTHENTRSPTQRATMIDKWDDIIENRLVEGGKIVFLTNAHHPQDLAHKLKKRPGWHVISDSALIGVRSAEGWDPATVVPLWPKQWPVERLLRKLAEIGPVAFARKFLNVAIDESTQRFKPQWIAACLIKGRGLYFVTEIDPSEYPRVAVGVDFGTRPDKDSDLTVFYIFALLDDGRRRLLNIEAGRWDAPEILRRMHSINGRYGQPFFYAEDNGAQAFIIQMGREAVKGLNIVPMTTTGSSKWDEIWGVESMAVEMYNGRWVLPSGGWTPVEDLSNLQGLNPDMSAFIEDMIFYRPDTHSGDYLMASWIGREGVRTGRVESFAFDGLRR